MGAPGRSFLTQRGIPKVLRTVEWLENRFSLWNVGSLPPIVTAAKPTHLFISHGRGGGAEKHVEEQVEQCRRHGEQTLVLTFDLMHRRFTVDRWHFYRTKSLLKYLKAQNVKHIHVHHLRYFPYRFVEHLPQLAKALEAEYDVTLHDFMSFCPRIHLMNEHWRYCGMPQDAESCNQCISKNGMLTSAPYDIARWRANWQRMFDKAKAVFTPSRDTAARHAVFFPGTSITPWRQVSDASLMNRAPDKPLPRGKSERATIALVGHIYPLKGAHILLACARDARERKLPLQFTVIGHCTESTMLKLLDVPMTGSYTLDQLPKLLKKSRAHAVFLPSTWPETYSYVLSEIWQNGYFPITFDLGAPAERIRSAGKGALLPVELMNNARAINDRLLELTA